MALYKVKIEQGAFINDTLFREGEIVELAEGLDPMWGVKCKEDGTELEDMSAKIRARSKLNEHLAKSIEGDAGKATRALAKENAELKLSLESLQDQVSKLTEVITAQQAGQPGGPDPVKEDGGEGDAKGKGKDTPPAPELTEEVKAQVDEAVQLLEDANDDQWTSRGEPKLDVLKDLTGLDLSRADVDAANPRRREKPKAE